MSGKRCRVCNNREPKVTFEPQRRVCVACRRKSKRGFYENVDNHARLVASNRQWRNSPEGREWYANYRKTSDEYKKKNNRAGRKYKAAHAEKISAHKAVSRAVERGTIPKVKSLKCSRCPKQAVEYHHHNGYAEEHKLDVVALCKGCHAKTYVAAGLVAKTS